MLVTLNETAVQDLTEMLSSKSELSEIENYLNNYFKTISDHEELSASLRCAKENLKSILSHNFDTFIGGDIPLSQIKEVIEDLGYSSHLRNMQPYYIVMDIFNSKDNYVYTIKYNWADSVVEIYNDGRDFCC